MEEKRKLALAGGIFSGLEGKGPGKSAWISPVPVTMRSHPSAEIGGQQGEMKDEMKIDLCWSLRANIRVK